MTPMEYLRWFLTGMAGCALAAYTFYQSLTAFFISLPLAVVYPFYKRKALKEKRKRKLLVEFKEALMIVSSFLGAGYATENAFQAAVPELMHLFGANAYIVQEFQGICRGIENNKALEGLLEDFAERSELDDIWNFSEVFAAAKRSGGELVKIIAHTAEVIRDKVGIEEEILTMTSAKRYEQRIMNMVPFLIIIYMNLSSPEFFAVLYTSLLGRAVMTGCLAVYVLSVILADRIMAIAV